MADCLVASMAFIETVRGVLTLFWGIYDFDMYAHTHTHTLTHSHTTLTQNLVLNASVPEAAFQYENECSFNRDGCENQYYLLSNSSHFAVVVVREESKNN